MDAHDIVTGKKQFSMDRAVPGALPTMVCRPPELNGSPAAIKNPAAIKSMPEVTNVAMVDTGSPSARRRSASASTPSAPSGSPGTAAARRGSRIRATVLAGHVLTFEQRHTSVSTDFSHGLGERLTAMADELMMDMLAKKLKLDPLALRQKFLRSERAKAVLRKVAGAGRWGRSMPAVDAGLVVNPKGREAQMMGGVSDGIALVLTSSCHLKDGHFLEASWDNYFYTRQWNIPPVFECHVLPSDSQQPGGAGEAGVSATVAATACAFARATGKVPTSFPINHDTLSFTPKTFIPPVPESPTDGLSYTY